MRSKSKFLAQNGRVKTFLMLGGLLMVLAIIISMVVGIVANGRDRSYPAATNQAAQTDGLYATGGGQGATTAAAAALPSSGLAQSDNAAKGDAGSTGSSGSAVSQPLPVDRLIVRNATVSLSAQDVDKTLLELRSLATEKNGLVFGSNTTSRDNQTYASLTLQVPANTFDDVLVRLHRLSGVKVEKEDTTSQDVTEEYVDLQAQLNNLKATEVQLTNLLSKTTNVAETLTVQRELTTVRGQIDQRQGRINYLDKRTSMSSIALTVSPANIPATVEKPAEWDAGHVLSSAWAGSVRGLEGLFEIVATFGVWGVWLVPMLLIAFWLSVKLWRRLFPRRLTTTPVLPVASGDGTV